MKMDMDVASVDGWLSDMSISNLSVVCTVNYKRRQRQCFHLTKVINPYFIDTGIWNLLC
jgi:hypothetical protein